MAGAAKRAARHPWPAGQPPPALARRTTAAAAVTRPAPFPPSALVGRWAGRPGGWTARAWHLARASPLAASLVGRGEVTEASGGGQTASGRPPAPVGDPRRLGPPRFEGRRLGSAASPALWLPRRRRRRPQPPPAPARARAGAPRAGAATFARRPQRSICPCVAAVFCERVRRRGPRAVPHAAAPPTCLSSRRGGGGSGRPHPPHPLLPPPARSGDVTVLLGKEFWGRWAARGQQQVGGWRGEGVAGGATAGPQPTPPPPPSARGKVQGNWQEERNRRLGAGERGRRCMEAKPPSRCSPGGRGCDGGSRCGGSGSGGRVGGRGGARGGDRVGSTGGGYGGDRAHRAWRVTASGGVVVAPPGTAAAVAAGLAPPPPPPRRRGGAAR